MSRNSQYSSLLMRLWQQSQLQLFLNMIPQAWYTWFRCSTSQAPSGWMESIVHSDIQISAEMFQWIQVCALAGPLKNIHRVVPKPLLRYLGCVLRVGDLLKGEPSPQVKSPLEQVFIQDASVHSSSPLS